MQSPVLLASISYQRHFLPMSFLTNVISYQRHFLPTSFLTDVEYEQCELPVRLDRRQELRWR
jgi:hypothetical protein